MVLYVYYLVKFSPYACLYYLVNYEVGIKNKQTNKNKTTKTTTTKKNRKQKKKKNKTKTKDPPKKQQINNICSFFKYAIIWKACDCLLSTI